MYFSRVFIALAAPFLVCAQTTGPNAFKVPSSGYAVAAGKTVTLEWTPTTSGTVSLYLREGNSANLGKGQAIATGLQNSGSYTWSVPSSAVAGSGYAVEIVDDSNPNNVNYTPQFALASDNTSSASSSNTTSSTSSSATSSSNSSSSASTTGSSSNRTSTTSNTSTRPSSSNTSSAGFQSTSTPTGAAAPQATVFAGYLGGLALAALAL